MNYILLLLHTKLKGEEVSNVEVFEETHKKKNKDGTRGEWIESRAEETFVSYKTLILYYLTQVELIKFLECCSHVEFLDTTYLSIDK